MENFFTWNPDGIREAIAAYGALAPLAYMVFNSLAIALMAPGIPLLLVGIALFGPVSGTIYSFISGMVGATISFLIARHFGRQVKRAAFKSHTRAITELSAYEKKIARNGFAVVFFLRLFPIFPPGALNFALGLTAVSLRSYVLGTILGVLPSTILFAYFGSSLIYLDTSRILIAVALFTLLSLAFIPLKKWWLAQKEEK